MPGNAGEPAGTQQAELGTLLAGAVAAVAEAQDVLDEHARQRAGAYLHSPPGCLSLPPLAYAFASVSIDIELSAEVVQSKADGVVGTRLLCRTLNPVTAGLFGYSASAGTRVRVALSPQRFAVAGLPAQEVPPSPE